MKRLVQVPGAKFEAAVGLDEIEKIISAKNVPDFYVAWCPSHMFNVGAEYQSLVVLDTDGQVVPSTESVSALIGWYNDEQAHLLQRSESIKESAKIQAVEKHSGD